MMNDDDNDFDAGLNENPNEKKALKSSLQESWNTNPLMKIAAVVLGVAVLGGAWAMFGPADEDLNRSKVTTTENQTIKVVPGKNAVDAEYQAAVEQENKQRVDDALKGGGSAVPTAIGAAKTDSLDIPPVDAQNQDDPLAEWRARAEAKRALEGNILPGDEPEAQPDVVPMVTPVRPQAAMKMDPNAAKALAQQMRTLIAAQVPPRARTTKITQEESDYMLQKHAEEAQKAEDARATSEGNVAGNTLGGTTAGRAGGQSTQNKLADKKVIVPAGNIAYAQLLTELNSDIKGPALAQILSGPFTGGRALGQFTTQDEYLVITFKRIIKDGVSYDMNGIALNEDTTLAGQQTEVNNHYFSRVILPAAARFVQGYASAVSETGTRSTVTNGGGVVQDVPEPDATQELYKGFEAASGRVGAILDEKADKPITVIVAKGTTLGILFMDSVTTLSAEQ